MTRVLKILSRTLIVLGFLGSPVQARVKSGDLVINEFLASNRAQFEDPDEPGEFPDWIELYNPTTSDINMGGFYLTDNLTRTTKWQIPWNINIPAGGYLLFLADSDPAQGDIHTNFKLNANNGQIGLVDADGKTFIDSLTYGKQTADVAYGRYPDGSTTWHFFARPTPAAPNNQGYLGEVAEVQFSHERGFYDQHFALSLICPTENAKIHYTLDGSEPQTSTGRGTSRYTGPISITTTTCVRAKALLSGWKTSTSVTHTYLFLDAVVKQPAQPAGFPTNWAHTGVGDYEMDPKVVNDPRYRNTIKNDLKAVPSLSLVMDVDDWFGGNGQGIYLEGELEARAVSAELIYPDGLTGFQINCAVMIVGGTSTDRWKSDKLSMRLKFKSEYGPPVLKFPLFGDDATDEFDTVVLDARLNHAWHYGGNVKVQGRPLSQRDTAQYTRDPFVSDLQNLMGGFAPHGRHVHLYLNGLYWGLYWIHERPDEHFAASYFGGSAEDYDVLKHNADLVINGSNANYLELFQIANAGLMTSKQYQLIQQYLDVPGLIDYLIINFFQIGRAHV